LTDHTTTNTAGSAKDLRGNPLTFPPFNAEGDLPLGVHPATLREVLDHLATGTAQRQAVGLRLERIYRVAATTGHLGRFVVYGSFVTDKPEPNDVDVFLLMEDSFDASQLSGEATLLFDHPAAQAHFGASVFWLRRLAAWEGEQAAVEYWQVKRGGGQRGIVEIVSGGP
jgi:hypothetical protein